MGFYDDRVLPHILNLALSTKAVRAERARCLAGVIGDVLEIGFGSGLNVPHYGAGVTRVVGVDPAQTSARLARARIAAAPFPVELIGLSAERLPLADASVGTIVSTFTLCTIPDAVGALLEMRRVLSSGGRLHFVEHGRSDDEGVRRWQDRLNSTQRRLFGGCNLNRDISALLEEAGFAIERLDHAHLEGAPRFAGYLYRGVATR